MTFLPIVIRELRAAARRPATYWTRVGAACAVIVLGGYLFLDMRQSTPQELAMELFGTMAGCAVFYALFSGLFATADCISQEKREGTLGLLFLTDLKGYDIVLGKLVASSINAFYGMVAVLPILAVPLLLGGLTGQEIARMAAVAANTLFLSLAVGMASSSMCRSARSSVFTALLVLLILAAVLPLTELLLRTLGKAPAHPLFMSTSPGFAFAMAFDTNYKTGAKLFWQSLGVIHALGWFSLLLASVVTPRTWQDRPAGEKTLRRRHYWLDWSLGTPQERGVFRSRLLNENAYFWLCARARLKPLMVWAVLGAVACIWGWGTARWRRDWLNSGTYVTTAIFLNLLLKLWVCQEAGKQLAEDRKAGTLELLLSTPLTVPEILRGQRLALQRQFLGPAVAVLVCFGLFLVGCLFESGMEDDRTPLILIWLGSMLMLVMDLAAIYWVSLWQALVARSPGRAVLGTLTRLLFIPPLAYAGVAVATSLLLALFQFEQLEWPFFTTTWFLLGLGADIGFSLHARHKLLTQFRLAAEQRYAVRLGLWRRIRDSIARRPGRLE